MIPAVWVRGVAAASPQSPNLAPSDFLLFGPLKQHLSRQQFVNEEEVIAVVMTLFRYLNRFLCKGLHFACLLLLQLPQQRGDHVKNNVIMCASVQAVVSQWVVRNGMSQCRCAPYFRNIPCIIQFFVEVIKSVLIAFHSCFMKCLFEVLLHWYQISKRI
jgi:hypothetical protein